MTELETAPGFGPTMPEGHGLLLTHRNYAICKIARASPQETQRERKRAAVQSRPSVCLLLLFSSFLPAALTRQSFFHALFFAGFEIKGVPLDLLDDVFLLHLPLEAAKCIFKGFSLLQSDFCQRAYTPKPVQYGLDSYCKTAHTKSSDKSCPRLRQPGGFTA